MVTARVRYASLSHRRLPETHAIAIFVWLALFYGCVFFFGGGESLHVFCGRRNTSKRLNISLSFSRGRHSYVVVSWIAVNKHGTMSNVVVGAASCELLRKWPTLRKNHTFGAVSISIRKTRRMKSSFFSFNVSKLELVLDAMLVLDALREISAVWHETLLLQYKLVAWNLEEVSRETLVLAACCVQVG